MTTIVYRDNVLAADSLAFRGDTRLPTEEVKLRRLSDGSVFALCGGAARLLQMERWLNDNAGEIDKIPIGNSTAVHLPLTGPLMVYEDGGWYEHPRDQFAAFGGGFQFAYGALHLGASAEQAVGVASVYDAGTGGKVVSMSPEASSRPELVRGVGHLRGLGY